MMTKLLSSFMTFFLKFIFTGILILTSLMLMSTLIIWPILSHQVIFLPTVIFALVFSSIALSWCYMVTIPLKKVSVDERNLYISNYFKEIAVPLSEIDRVEELNEFRAKLILIHLKSTTKFGQEIKFLPQTEFRWRWKEHSVVGALKEMAKAQDQR